MLGDDGSRNERNISGGTERSTGFLRGDYDVTDDLNVFVEGNYGKATANWDQYYNYTYATAAPTIYANNAFLPDVIRDRMEGVVGVEDRKSTRLNSSH